MGNKRVRVAMLAGLLCQPWSQVPIAAQAVAANGQPARTVTATVVTVRVTDTPLETVLESIAMQAGLTMVYGAHMEQTARHVTLTLQDVPVLDAFNRALAGTDLTAQIVARKVVLVPTRGAFVASGIIVGRITDAKTEESLRNVTITLDDTKKGVMSDNDGKFKFTAVSAGDHVIHTRLLGYEKSSKSVTVTDGETITANFALIRSLNMLDQVVVTGTVIATELKAVPNAITVITAKDIERRGITHIDQLFRGDVPGLFALQQGSGTPMDQVLMFSRGATAFPASQSAGTSSATNPIKTYVDGVELADPQYLSQLDPRSIERIEILTGPQASTIYGSNAINGVMQIFTKRGSTAQPQLTLNFLSGLVQNNFSSARTPQHDLSAQLAGVEGRMSYNAGGSWNFMGAWTPAKQTAVASGFAGARLALPTALGPVTADMTIRRSNTQNLQRGATDQGATNEMESGYYYLGGGAGLSVPTMYVLKSQTLGLTLNYAPTNWWSHEVGIGQDAEDTEQRTTTRGYQFVGDTTLTLDQTHADRRSLRYTTTARVPVTAVVQGSITVGADAWQNLTTAMYMQPLTLTGSLRDVNGAPYMTRQPGHNRGGFLQAQLGVFDQLFFTYGLRAEWNPGYGSAAEPDYAPRYGVAYTTEVGPVTAKIRASYGHATRPPDVTTKQAQANPSSSLTPIYGTYNSTIANPNLGPEFQRGGEGGLELYLGTRGSLVITRYNQTVDGIIISVPGADSIRSLQPHPVYFGFADCLLIMRFHLPTVCSSQDAAGYGYAELQQNQNAAAIRNEGWELQGSVVTGPLTTKGTYSWTKSRSLGVFHQYLSKFDVIGYPTFQPGATFDYLPEHTWAVGMTYVQAATTVAFNLTGVGRLVTTNDARTWHRYLDFGIRLDQNRGREETTGDYVSANNGYVLADLNATHRFSSSVESVVQVQNLANRYANDRIGSWASMGRQTKVGFRLSLR